MQLGSLQTGTATATTEQKEHKEQGEHLTTELWMLIFYLVGTLFGCWLGWYSRNLIEADLVIEGLAEQGIIRVVRDSNGQIQEILKWDGSRLDA